jgi:Methyltransferase domain
VLPENPDRHRWNERYGGDFVAPFTGHELAARSLAEPLPDGPVLDLASGPSGSALLAAAAGRMVTAVDVSDVALGLLGAEAERRGLGGLITLVQADLTDWCPPPANYALVLCTGYWDRGAFARGAAAVARGGLLGWEAFTQEARRVRPRLPADWCLGPGEPAALLPAGFAVLEQRDLNSSPGGARRRLLARRGWLTPGRRVPRSGDEDRADHQVEAAQRDLRARRHSGEPPSLV